MPSAARLGDKAQVDADAHGCPACPHPPSSIVNRLAGRLVNSKPARGRTISASTPSAADRTLHHPARLADGDVNGKPFARMNDQTKHCGASGPSSRAPRRHIDDGAGAQGLGSYAMNALSDPAAEHCGAEEAQSSESRAIRTRLPRPAAEPRHDSFAGSGEVGAVVRAAREKRPVRSTSGSSARDLTGSLTIEIWAARCRRNPGTEDALAAAERGAEREAEVEGDDPAAAPAATRSSSVPGERRPRGAGQLGHAVRRAASVPFLV